MKFLVLDYETRSRAELKKVGSYEYARHPSTQILCVSWRLGTREELRHQLESGVPAKRWSPAIPSPYGELISALCDPSVTLVAHNALFEQVITRFVLSKIIHRMELKALPISRWMCTAALAAAVALPRKLEEACKVLELPVQKDMEGRRLMLKLSKPRRPTKNNPAEWHQKKSDLLRVMDYCATDVDAESHLLLSVPMLNETERKVWELDQKINWRGFYVDRPLVKTVLTMVGEELLNFKERMRLLSKGEIETANQRDKIQAWLKERGCILPDLRANTIRDALASGVAEGEALEMLKLRQAAAKSSIKKYQAFEMRSRTDGRCRDILKYHQASPGRWGGAGVQPQNFPRGMFKSFEQVEQAIEALESGNLEWVRMLYGLPMEVFSSCLRAMIQATPGMEIFCADYNAIETRVLFWVAKHEAGVKAFLEDQPIYAEMGAAIFDKPLDEIENPSFERDLGKRAILGCGYGMGAPKFKLTCKEQGNIEISDELALKAVRAYREKHKPVVQLWHNLERAAIAAVKTGKRVRVNRVTWFVEGKFLFCELPSGRRLAYFGPEIKYEKSKWSEEKRPVLYHWGMDDKQRWVFSGTYGGKLTENICQAIARDLMAAGMLRIDERGYLITLSVHDELKGEKPKGQGSLDEFIKLMTEGTTWAKGCPVKAAGWQGLRYRK